MATNPMLQAVLLFQHHQTTTPYMPKPGVAGLAASAAAAETEKKTEKEEEEEEEKEPEEEEKNG